MIRTIVSLDAADKEWLDRAAQRNKVSRAEIVRRALRRLREEEVEKTPSFDALLDASAGIWTGDDGLIHQRRLRAEWPEPGEER